MFTSAGEKFDIQSSIYLHLSTSYDNVTIVYVLSIHNTRMLRNLVSANLQTSLDHPHFALPSRLKVRLVRSAGSLVQAERQGTLWGGGRVAQVTPVSSLLLRAVENQKTGKEIYERLPSWCFVFSCLAPGYAHEFAGSFGCNAVKPRFAEVLTRRSRITTNNPRWRIRSILFRFIGASAGMQTICNFTQSQLQ